MPHPGPPDRARASARCSARCRRVQRLVRGAIYWGREMLVLPFTLPPPQRACPSGWRARTCERQVADPELRAELTPDYEIGCKRILMSNEYFPALQQPNVELVTERDRARSAGTASSPPTASSTRPTRSSGAPASTSPTCRSPSGVRGRDGAPARRRLARAGHAGACAARRSPASRTCSCSSARTPASATTRSSS